MANSWRMVVLAALLAQLLPACGDDTGTGAGGNGGEPGAGGGGAPSTGGGGASAGGGGAGGSEPFVPTPEDVQFQSVNPMPLGEWLVINDWNPSPNEVLVMRPDGTNEVTIFRAYRIWSMGVSQDRDRIAFAAGDPEQEAHYGVTLGDAIQPTFIYDATLEAAQNLTYGNLSDECHRFGPGDKFLYVCRRYDYDAEGGFKGYRIARIDLETTELTFLADLDPASMTLHAEPNADESQLYFTRVPIPGARSISRAPLPNASPEETFLEDASTPVLSPDGTRMLLQDSTQQGSIVAIDLETQSKVLVAQGPDLSNAAWSPDGSKVAFLRWDDGAVCSHVEIASADGSDVAEPTRVHDCADSGRFVTQLEWILR